MRMRMSRSALSGPKLGSFITVAALETAIFLALVAFLEVEGVAAILVTILGTIGISVAVGRMGQLSRILKAAFQRQRRFAIGLGALYALAFPFVLHENPYAIHMLFVVGIYAILAIGLDFQVGASNIVNFATAASYGVGAYAAALMAVHLGWSFWVILPLSGLTAALFGFLLGLPTMRTKVYYLSMVTLAAGLIIYLLLNNLSWTGGPNGIAGIPYPTVGHFDFGENASVFGVELPFQANFYYLILAVLGVEYVVAKRLYMSKIGLAWNAIRDDEIAAECQGIDVTGYKIMAFYTNAFFDGFAGAIYAFNVGFISPENFSFMLSVIAITMVLVGGMGNPVGVLLGAVLLTLIPEKFQILESYRLWLFSLIMLGVLLIRPRGLFPEKTRAYA